MGTTASPSSQEIFDYLRKHVRGEAPINPYAEELANAGRVLKQTYDVSYIQHTPMETRAAVAEWNGDKLTVWTGTSNPFSCRGELARTFHVPDDGVRVIVPDYGRRFWRKTHRRGSRGGCAPGPGGRQTRVVKVDPRGRIHLGLFPSRGGHRHRSLIGRQGQLTSWHFVNINSGGAAINTPYRVGKADCRFVQSDSPLRQSSYRALAATANNFARECFMDELAAAAGMDPLDFRLAHLENPRLRAVLEEAAKQFNWREKVKQKQPGVGYGPGLRNRKKLCRGGLRGNRRRPGKKQHLGTARVPGLRMRRDPESSQSHLPGAGLHHHGHGPGPARGNAL